MLSEALEYTEVSVKTPNGVYPIFVGGGILDRLDLFISKPKQEHAKILVVADSNTSRLFEERIVEQLKAMGYEVSSYVFPAGEESKTLSTLQGIVEAAFAMGLGRKDAMLALGGGVVGDVTGFASSIFMRGIDYIQIPTTLLAQIDSSVGGKTAIDTPFGKNLVGTFKQPKLVLADTDCLETLDSTQIASGMAEIIKYGLLEGKEFWQGILDQSSAIPSLKLIVESIRAKVRIVEEDEKETGIRAVLNLGHSFGHALETETQFTRYTHGAAVGIGILATLRIGELLGVTDKRLLPQVLSVLQRFGLETYTDISATTCVNHLLMDKKHEGDKIKFVLLEDFGEPVLHPISDRDIYSLSMSLNGFCFDVKGLPNIVKIKHSELSAIIYPPPSKSMAHRMVLATALAMQKDGRDFRSVIENYHESVSQDILATSECIEKLLRSASEGNTECLDLDCRESGSTIRFMIPVAAALGQSVRFHGQGRLPNRPLDDFIEPLCCNGVRMDFPQKEGESLPLTISGKLEAGHYVLRGDSSSQYISGMLFAMSLLDKDSSLELSTHLESAAYVDLTIETLRFFGVKIRTEERNGRMYYFCSGDQRPCLPDGKITVERDYSQSAFWYLAEFLGHEIRVDGMKENSSQGDKAILSCLESLKNRRDNENIEQEVIAIDVSQFPDLFPALGVAAALAGEGKVTRLVNAARLKIKESDRLAATADMLQRMGVPCKMGEDSLEIEAVAFLRGADLDSYGDHRLAMAGCIAALSAVGESAISNASAIKKSYPSFYRELIRCGAALEFS